MSEFPKAAMPRVPAGGRTELKVRAASAATFLASLAGVILLQTSATDWVKDLPVWAQAPGAALILAGITWLTGRQAKSKPDYLSPSTIEAVQAWMRQRMPR